MVHRKESVLREDSEDAETQHGGVAPRTALAGQQVQQVQGHGEAVGSASVNLFNTGIYAMRSNNATLRLVEKWLAARDATSNDQVILNSLAYKEYVVSGWAGSGWAGREAAINGVACLYDASRCVPQLPVAGR